MDVRFRQMSMGTNGPGNGGENRRHGHPKDQYGTPPHNVDNQNGRDGRDDAHGSDHGSV